MAEKDTSRLLIFNLRRRRCRMAHLLEAALFSPEEVGMQVQILPWLPPVFLFFSLIVFLPSGFLLLILTADPVSFARFCENVFLVTKYSSERFLSICGDKMSF